MERNKILVQSHYSAREMEIERDREREEGRIREIGERMIKRVVGDRERGCRGREGAGRDRSDRVAYGVVAGSRKEQQIQWLYRPSPV